MPMHRMSRTSHVSTALALALALSSATSKAMHSSTGLPVNVSLEKEVRVALGIVTRISASDAVNIGSERVERFGDVECLLPNHVLQKAEGNLDFYVAGQGAEERVWVRGLGAVPLVF